MTKLILFIVIIICISNCVQKIGADDRPIAMVFTANDGATCYAIYWQGSVIGGNCK